MAELRVRLLWNIVSHSGDSVIIYPLLVLAYLIVEPDNRQAVLTLLTGALVTSLLVLIVKQIVRKKRPAFKGNSIMLKTDPYSFPSGHAARTFSIVIILAGSGYILPSFVLLLWALTVSVARVKLELHYITDILAGILIGIIVGLIMIF